MKTQEQANVSSLKGEKMINSVVLSGRLTKDIEVKQTPSGKNVCTFSLATDDGFGDNKQTYFHNYVAWEKRADNLSKYAHKGDLLTIKGKLTSRSYDNKGTKVFVTEILVEDFQLPAKTKEEPKENKSVFEVQHERRQTERFSDDLFANTPSLDISSDNLPFY